MFFNIIFNVCFLVFYVAFFVICVLCIVLCIVSQFVYICLYHIFVQFYRPLSPGANPISVNKYYNISFNIVAQCLFPII